MRMPQKPILNSIESIRSENLSGYSLLSKQLKFDALKQ